MYTAGLIGLGGYIPGKPLSPERRHALTRFLRSRASLPAEYIDQIEQDGVLPGTVETNHSGWESQPWFPAWLERLPEKKRKDPFSGSKERRRVPLDPFSVSHSIHPHPMLGSDAETIAGAMAIVSTQVNPDDIDLVMVTTMVPDRPVPLDACLVQHKLALRNAGAYNIDSCCSSFVTMCELAAGLIRSGIKQRILLVSSYIGSCVIDRSEYYSPCAGDAAVAAIMTRVPPGYGYLASHSTSHGDLHAAIVHKRRQPFLHVESSFSPTQAKEYVTFLDPQALQGVAEKSKEYTAEVALAALDKAKLTPPDVRLLVTHQPIRWAPYAWREAVGVSEESLFESYERYGNIACASVPTNLLEAIEAKRLAAGEVVMMLSPGAGENHIAVLERATPELVANSWT
ncbi:MAG TPA: 3-oxoacyl-[acyl-carrier-protein] synthase III C-terminal domain-containing protein [Polyangia bacterium]|jgi:3-oxoacyl-[acyl-carrier-protein] synthase-3